MKKNRRYAASFSLEGAYIFSLLFLTLALVLQYAFRARDQSAAGCLLSEGAAAAAHLEPVYAPDSGSADSIAAALTDRTGCLASWLGAGPTVTRGKRKASASLEGSMPLREERTVNNPEGAMRAATALDRFRSGAASAGERKSP